MMAAMVAMRSIWETRASETVAGVDDAGPANDEGDAVAAFVDVAFEAAQGKRGPVVEFLGAFVGVLLRAVVGGEDDEGVVGVAGFF